MSSLYWLVAGVLLVSYSVYYYRCFARNLAAAKRSGIPYIVLPVYTFNRFWLVTHRIWLPILEKLPVSWTHPWIIYLDPDFTWTEKFKPFVNLGADALLIVAPGKNTLHVADPGAILQITTRRNDFPKPIELYGSVDLYGKNVVTTEGSIWRHHRKITAPPFTEKNNHLVWLESLHQGKSMMDSWTGKVAEGIQTRTLVTDVASATMRLSLHVVSRAGFGVRLQWPHEELEENGKAGAVPPGHTMTYKDALSSLLENIIPVMLLPRWFLERSPFKSIQHAHQSYVNWKKYMEEMYQEKKIEVQSGETREGMDLMGALVRGAGITADTLSSNDPEKGQATKQLLTDEEILGNAFVFILAGHETAANTLHFSILFLAMNWASQAHLQADLDDIFGTAPISAWDYERDVPKLFGSMAGAVMNEELRLIPPVIGIPKCVPEALGPQPLTLAGGRRVVVPADTYVTLNAPATHRNPRYWPTMCGANASPEEITNDLNAFKPERWLKSSGATPPSQHLATEDAAGSADEADDIGGPQSADTSNSLFHPQRGAYIPFSEGYRACLGRRFAQVEVLAVLAVIFRDYSVELAVDEFGASDDEVEGMDEEARRRVWDKAKTRAEDLLQNGMGTIITIQMRKGKVPMRFVKRGSERFKFG